MINLQTYGYSLKQSFKNMTKNRLMTIASISTMAACLFVIGIFFIILSNFQFMLENMQTEVGIMIYFNKGTTEKEIQSLENDIKKNRTEVKSVKYISPEEAWKRFKNSFDAEEGVLNGFEEDNPLKDSASLEVHLNEITKQQEFISYVEKKSKVRQVTYNKEVIKMFKGINKFFTYVSIVIIGILLFIALFLINNTVRIGISIRKNEIRIMKLIGATDHFIRRPFIMEGVLIGMVGATIPILIIFFSYNSIVKYIYNNFGVLKVFLNFRELNTMFSILVPLCFGIGVGIGIIGSGWTLRKHLRV